jgi:general secretion pathway protein H
VTRATTRAAVDDAPDATRAGDRRERARVLLPGMRHAAATFGPAAGAADAGLTLLEMLIVLAVIAVATGATALSLGPRRDGAPAATARQLAAAIQAAADRSIATGARDVLVVDRDGYTLGALRQPLPPDLVVDAPPAVPVAVDGAPFDVALTDGAERWRVSFDGWRAVAARDAR